MYRNLHTRVEAVVPVQCRADRERLWEIFAIPLNDFVSGWDMNPSGAYTKRTVADGLAEDDPRALGTHALLMQRTLERSRPAAHG